MRENRHKGEEMNDEALSIRLGEEVIAAMLNLTAKDRLVEYQRDVEWRRNLPSLLSLQL